MEKYGSLKSLLILIFKKIKYCVIVYVIKVVKNEILDVFLLVNIIFYVLKGGKILSLEILGYSIPYEIILLVSAILCGAGFLFAFIALIVSSNLRRKYKKINHPS